MNHSTNTGDGKSKIFVLTKRFAILNSTRRSKKDKTGDTQKVQLRLTGLATLHADDALADEQWSAATLMSRRSYWTVVGPGTPSDTPTSGLPDFLENRSPTLGESETGRKHFVVIACRVDFLDWYFLRAQGHRRAQFLWQGSEMTAQWVAP